MSDNLQHKSAIISSKAQIGENVSIGAYCIIEDDVIIGNNTKIDSHAIIKQYTTIGSNCHIFSLLVLNLLQVDSQ